MRSTCAVPRATRLRLLVSTFALLLITLYAGVVASPAGATPHGPPLAKAGAAQFVPPPNPSSGCIKTLNFGLAEFTTTGCFTADSPTHWHTTDTFKLNNIPLPVIAGTQAEFTEPDTAHQGGQISVSTNFAINGIVIRSGLFQASLPAGGPGSTMDLFRIGASPNESFLGFPLKGNVGVSLAEDAAGTHFAYFNLELGLPSILKAAPNGQGGLSVALNVKFSPSGPDLNGLFIQVNHAYFNGIGVDNFCLAYNTGQGDSYTGQCQPLKFGSEPLIECQAAPKGTSSWTGSLNLVLPTGGSGSKIGAYVGVYGSQFAYAGVQATNLGDNLELAPGIFLDRVGLGLCVNPPPFKIAAGAGIRFGPEIHGIPLLVLDGKFTYTDTGPPVTTRKAIVVPRPVPHTEMTDIVTQTPWELRADGSLEVFTFKLASGHFSINGAGSLDLGFQAGFNLANIIKVNGTVVGWMELKKKGKFNVNGHAQVCLLAACAMADVTVSDIGLAGCIELARIPYPVYIKHADWKWYAPWRAHWETRHTSIRGGAGARWGESVQTMGQSCSTAGYQAARATASASGDIPLKITGPGDAFKVQGLSASPKFVLKNSAGQIVFTSPAAASEIHHGKDMYLEDAANKTTDFMIVGLPPGAYTLSPLPGYQASTVATAPIETPPGMVAGVHHLHGKVYTLGYSWQPHGQKSMFVERTRGRSDTKVLGDAGGKPCPKVPKTIGTRPLCGELHFTPSFGDGGVRDIYEIPIGSDGAEQDYEQHLVATYVAPPMPAEEAPRNVTLTRKNGNMEIHWKDTQRMRMHNMIVQDLTTGERIDFEHKGVVGMAEHELVPNMPLGDKIRVKIQAFEEDPMLRLSQEITVTALPNQIVAREHKLRAIGTKNRTPKKKVKKH